MKIEEQTMAIDGTPFTARVAIAGGGAPLIYLHGPTGHAWTPLHERLAERFTVHAPLHPGWESLDDLDHLDSVADLVLYYVDILDRYGIERASLVGHSVGGMVAAEIAAARPDRVERLALVAPWGLWRDDEPTADFWGQPPERLATALWSDPSGEAALANAPVREPEAMLSAYLANSAAAHFTWPIPDNNLRRRLHRVVAPTLLVWGQDDGIVPLSYADDFVELLPDASSIVLEGGAHNVHLERADVVADAILDHLASAAVGA